MDNKQFILIRTIENENETRGILLVINNSANAIEFIGKTLENTSTIFPKGKYKIKWEYSPKFQKDLWELKGIQGRSEIKIHQGTIWQHGAGCILLSIQNLNEMHQKMSNQKTSTIIVL